MKALFTFLTLCSLAAFAAGCGETPQPADTGADADTSPELGEATGDPAVSLGEQEEPPVDGDGADDAEEGDDGGGPELPAQN